MNFRLETPATLCADIAASAATHPGTRLTADQIADVLYVTAKDIVGAENFERPLDSDKLIELQRTLGHLAEFAAAHCYPSHE